MCEFYSKAYLTLTSVNIKKVLNEADTVKKVKDLLLAFTNCTADKKEFNKRNIHVVFPIGLTITPSEKERKTEEILTNLSLVEPSRYNKSKGTKMIKSYIEFIKTSINIDGTKVKAYKVKSHNPYKFTFKRNK